jgi:Domain of unknown function (DUF543)
MHHFIDLVYWFLGKTWPIALCTGLGLGMAYSEANHNFWSIEKKLFSNLNSSGRPISIDTNVEASH